MKLNQRGFLTIDFIFAMVLILGFTALLFVVSLTLSVVSITQYVTFAAARNYGAAHLDQATQEARGLAKFQELIGNKVFKPLYSNGWFKIGASPDIGDNTKVNSGYDQATQGVNEFWGVGVTFVAKILDFHIPFFGDSAPDSDGSGSGFTTYVGSYLGREPTADECLKVIAARYTHILSMPVSGGTSYSTAPNSNYYAIADDGC